MPYVPFSKEDALVLFAWDCLNLSVYKPSEKRQSLLQTSAASFLQAL